MSEIFLSAICRCPLARGRKDPEGRTVCKGADYPLFTDRNSPEVGLGMDVAFFFRGPLRFIVIFAPFLLLSGRLDNVRKSLAFVVCGVGGFFCAPANCCRK